MSTHGEKTSSEKVETMETVISKYLRIGVAVSAIIIIAGLSKLLIVGSGGYPVGHYPSSIGGIMKGLMAVKPDAIILAGLFLLILTPIFRVGVSIILFFKEKDYLYVLITSFVFIILLLGLFLGKAFGD